MLYQGSRQCWEKGIESGGVNQRLSGLFTVTKSGTQGDSGFICVVLMKGQISIKSKICAGWLKK